MVDSGSESRGNKGIWTVWAIIAACAVVEFTLIAADFGLLGSTRWRGLAYQFGGFWGGLLNGWRPNYPFQPVLMFVSYGFLHSGFVHFAVNMVSLFWLGRLVVQRIGQGRFVLLYMMSMIGGAATFAVLSSSIQPMIGASGALFGLVGALAAWEYIDRYSAGLRQWPVFQIILFLLVLNVTYWWAVNGQLAWETHLGGFVSGWIMALLIDPMSRPLPDGKAGKD